MGSSRGLIQRCPVCRKEGVYYRKKGSECKHKEAIWAVKFRVGKKQILKRIGKNKREAERFLEKMKSDLASGGSYQDLQPILFRELSERWLNNHRQSSNPKPGTIWAYDSRLKHHILPLLGHKVVSQIVPNDIEIAKQVIREKMSARSTNAVLITIGSVLRYGWKLGFCKSNPAQLVDKLRVETSVGMSISKEEAAVLLRHTNEPYRTIFFAMLCTGARVGEITALQWKDIDFKRNLITIERNVFHAPKGKYGMTGDKSWVFGTPKSKQSNRKVILIPSLKTALLRHSEQSQGNPLGLVFCTKLDNPFDRSTLQAKINSVTKAVSMKHVRLHDLRHTNATLLLADGVSLPYVQKHLGHSTAHITADIYHHAMPKEHEQGMNHLGSIFPVYDTAVIPSLPQRPAIKRK